MKTVNLCKFMAHYPDVLTKKLHFAASVYGNYYVGNVNFHIKTKEMISIFLMLCSCCYIAICIGNHKVSSSIWN